MWDITRADWKPAKQPDKTTTAAPPKLRIFVLRLAIKDGYPLPALTLGSKSTMFLG